MARRVMVVNHEASRSGAPRVALDVVQALRAAGDEVVLVHRWGGPFRAEMDAAASRARLETFARSRAALRRVKALRPIADRLEAWAARIEIRRNRPDLIWANTVLSAAYVPAARRAGIPIVFHAHENRGDMSRLFGRHHLLHDAAAWDGVTLVGCGPATSQALDEMTGVEPGRAVTVATAVDVSRVEGIGAARAVDAVVLTVSGCGMDPQRKGLDVFAEVARRVTAERPGRTHFRWIGASDAALVADAPVECAGPVADAAQRIAATDVFLLTSRDDQFPVVVLEAMAARLPVVAFSVGGVPDQIGAAGVLVAPGDVAAMTAAVVALVDDPAQRAALGVPASQRVAELWSITAFAAKVRAIADEARPQQ